MEIRSKKAEETRERIVINALEIFRKKGFDRTSIREIVEAAGYAKGTFYLYFETKVDLLCYIAEKLFKHFSDIIGDELLIIKDNPYEQISSALDKIFMDLMQEEGILRLFHTNEMLELILEQKVDRSFVDAITNHITEFLKAGIEKNYFRKLDAELYGKIIFNMAHNMLEASMLYQYPADIQVIKEELMIIIRKIVEK